MRGKKLLTFGCVVGILAWGACSSPGPSPPPEPDHSPPPLPLGWHGIERIRVNVTDATEARAIDSRMLERCIADSITALGPGGDPRGVLAGEARRGDAELNVVIESEETAPLPQHDSTGFTNWGFRVKLSGRLAREDGTVMWHGRNRVYSGDVSLPNGSTLWSSEKFAAGARGFICAPLVTRMLKSAHDSKDAILPVP